MKIGVETNSLVNHLQARGVRGEPEPVVGMGCTLLSWTDRYPGTIFKVEKPTNSATALYVIEVTQDDYTVTSGSQHDGSAEYAFAPRPHGATQLFRKSTKTERWELVTRSPATGRLTKSAGLSLRVGARDKYHDPTL